MDTERNWAKEIQDEMVKVESSKHTGQELKRGLKDKEKQRKVLVKALKEMEKTQPETPTEQGVTKQV